MEQPMASALFKRHDDLMCSTENGSDYYGLGVRLGIYFAWLSGYLANTLLESAIGSAADTNAIFLLTLLVVMVSDSMTGGLSQVDGLVIMHMSGGTIFGILTIWGYRTRLYVDHGPRAVGFFGSYGTHIRMLVSLTVSAYGFWFWIWGVDGALKPMGPDDGFEDEGQVNPVECGELYTFLFAKVKVHGGIRFYYAAVCAGCCAWFGAMLFASSLTAWFSIEKLIGTVHHRWARGAQVDKMARPRYITGFKTNELVMIFKVLRWANLGWLIFSAVLVEVTLNYNHIQGVLGGNDNQLDTPGQLLPFLVGLLGFIRTCYSLLQEKWLRKRRSAASRMNSGLSYTGPPQSAPVSPGMALTQRPFGPASLPQTDQLDRQQEGRSIFARYLVAWLPWLSLLYHYDQELYDHGILRDAVDVASGPTSPAPITGMAYVDPRTDPRLSYMYQESPTFRPGDKIF